MKNLKLIFVAIIMIASYSLTAQVAITTDGNSAAASAMLEVKSTVKGFLPPRMTAAERDAISSPANGLTIYNITTGCMNFYLSGTWVEICSGTGTPGADYTIGTGGSCVNTTVNGNYVISVALEASNTVFLNATVTTIGSWSITTDNINGYSFSGSGTFVATGAVQVTLTGSGTPTTAQTDNFTATASGSGGTCTFDVTVSGTPPWTCGDALVDSRDDQSYTTVEIGSQCWMAENLNIGIMINSTSGGTNNDGEQTDNSVFEKYCYANTTDNCGTYGGLYQWNEMMQYVTTAGTQGICPTGWHLPTDTEWKTMEMALGMSQSEADDTDWRGTDEGSKLAGNELLWTNGYLDENANFGTSGFTGLPGGYWDPDPDYGGFHNLPFRAYFWSSSENGTTAWRRLLIYTNTQVSRDNYDKANGFSVRCVRD